MEKTSNMLYSSANLNDTAKRLQALTIFLTVCEEDVSSNECAQERATAFLLPRCAVCINNIADEAECAAVVEAILAAAAR